MKAEERRKCIAQTLTAESPISATALAGQFSVSRQIIVGDIALLRARAAACGVSKLEQKGDTVSVTLEVFNFPAVSAICAEAAFKGRIFFAAGEKPVVNLKLKKGEDPLKLTQELIKRYQAVTAGANPAE